VRVFVKTDTTIFVFVGALLVTGWAGPYRVIRAELDRLAEQPFTESASALGVRRLPLVLRHHIPHLVPLLAMNASQQIVASLVLLAALGRRSAGRSLFNELAAAGAAAVVLGVALIVVVSGLVPERYAAAHEWAQGARAGIRAESDPARTFADAGLQPIAKTFSIERDT